MTEPARDTGEILQVIRENLSPYLGKLMASTAAVAHCRDLGISGTVMADPQVEQLLEKLNLGLVIFLGKEKAALVTAAMRREISGLPEITH